MRSTAAVEGKKRKERVEGQLGIQNAEPTLHTGNKTEVFSVKDLCSMQKDIRKRYQIYTYFSSPTRS